MKAFRGFLPMGTTAIEGMMHPKISNQIRTIRENCGFPTAAAFDVFWARLNEHLRTEWPTYEDTRRGALFTRAAKGEKITREELIGPHQELAGQLPAGGVKATDWIDDL